MSEHSNRNHFPAAAGSVFARVSTEQAGWAHLNMVAMRLETGKKFEITVDQYEYVMVILGGVCDIKTSRGDFPEIGRRPDVFTGMPYAIYLPRSTDFEIEALTDDFAMASFWGTATEDHPVRVIRPDTVSMSLEGAGAGSVQVNTLTEAGQGCQHLTVRELYVPGGNWYPHPPLLAEGAETLHLHKFDRPAGMAYQRLYGQGEQAEQAFTVRHDDVVAIAGGGYSAAVAPGSAAYILRVTYGKLQATVDPAWKWWNDLPPARDPRLPLVDRGMES